MYCINKTFIVNSNEKDQWSKGNLGSQSKKNQLITKPKTHFVDGKKKLT